MKTTKKQFIEYLQSLPDDTEISVVCGYDCGYSTCTKVVPLDLDPVTGNIEFTDLTGNQFIKPGASNENKKYLVLGEV